MTGEFAGFESRQTSADERQLDKEQTRAVLQRASDELVDMTVQTPWERQRRIDVDKDSVRERGLYENLTIRDRSRSKAQSRLIGGIGGWRA